MPAYLLVVLVIVLVALVLRSIALSLYLLRRRRDRPPEPVRGPQFSICGLQVPFHDLTSNILITGGTGSGKSGAGLLPAVAGVLASPQTGEYAIAGGLFIDSRRGLLAQLVEEESRGVRPVLNITVGSGTATYNLIDPVVPADEVAGDLLELVQVGTFPAGQKEGSNGLAECRLFLRRAVELLRERSESGEASVIDILRIANRGSELDRFLEQLPEGHSAARDYFTQQWPKLPPETAGFIMSVVGSAFGPFLSDPALGRQFCSHSNFSFWECTDRALMVTLTVPPEHETLRRLIAVALKQGFQRMARLRVTDPVHTRRDPLLFVADEADTLLVDSDKRWLSLSRSLHVISFVALHSEGWLEANIGADNARVLLQEFGVRVWFYSTDPVTNRRAEELCATAASSGGTGMPWGAGDFAGLDTLQSIAFSRSSRRSVRSTARPYELRQELRAAS